MNAGEPSVKPAAAPRGRQRAVPTNHAELRRRRGEAGLSLAALGRLAGTTKTNLSQIELGQYNAGEELLHRLADALGCPVEDLITSDNGNGDN